MIPTLDLIADNAREADDDVKAIPLGQTALVLLDWTDPNKVV